MHTWEGRLAVKTTISAKKRGRESISSKTLHINVCVCVCVYIFLLTNIFGRQRLKSFVDIIGLCFVTMEADRTEFCVDQTRTDLTDAKRSVHKFDKQCLGNSVYCMFGSYQKKKQNIILIIHPSLHLFPVPRSLIWYVYMLSILPQ